MGTSDKWGKELYFAISWEGSLTHPPTNLGVPYLCSFIITWTPYFGKRDMHTLYLGYRLPFGNNYKTPFLCFVRKYFPNYAPNTPFQPSYRPLCNQVCVCVCVGGGGGGGGHMHFEEFVCEHLGPSELGNSSRKPIGSGWRKVKSALEEKLSICMRNMDLLEEF